MINNDFKKEINGYSIDDLEIIINSQKDLYSEEEMEYIKSAYTNKKDDFIKARLPKKIKCTKCDMESDFSNDICPFCNSPFEKGKYYTLDFYEDDDAETTINDGKEYSESYVFQYVISLLIPLVGFITGAIMMSSDNEYKSSAGKTCVVLGIVSVIFSTIIWQVIK